MSGQSVHVIDPTDFSGEETELLWYFLRQATERRNFFGNQVKTLRKNRTYTVSLPDPANPQKIIAKKIKLTHTLVLRNRDVFGRLEPRFDVLQNAKFGSGYFSKVVRISGTLVAEKNGTLNYKTSKRRVIKIQHASFAHDQAKTSPKSEAKILRLTSSGAKKATIETVHPFLSRSYIVDEEFGESLLSLKKRGVTFTAEQQLTLSINLLRAVQSLHALGYAHIDLQPGNILIDEKSLEVRIIDFGFASKITRPKKAYDTLRTTLLLIQLWGGNVDGANKELYPTIPRKALDVIPLAVRPAVIKLLGDSSKMQSTIDSFEILRIMQKNPHIKEAEMQLLVSAYQTADEARKKLDSLQKSMRISSLTEIRTTIFSALEKIGASPDELQVFIDTINIKLFKGATNKAEIKTMTTQLLQNFAKGGNILLNLHNQTLALIKLTDRFPEYASKQEICGLKQLYHDIQTSLYKVEKKEYTLDNFFKLNQHFAKHIDRYGTTFEKFESKNYPKSLQFYNEIMSRLITEENHSNDPQVTFRNQLRIAVRNYLDATYTGTNVNKSDRAASERRRKEILRILEVIDFSKEGKVSSSQLEVEVKYSIAEINKNTGLFKRSKLRDNLKKVLKHRK